MIFYFKRSGDFYDIYIQIKYLLIQKQLMTIINFFFFVTLKYRFTIELCVVFPKENYICFSRGLLQTKN